MDCTALSLIGKLRLCIEKVCVINMKCNFNSMLSGNMQLQFLTTTIDVNVHQSQMTLHAPRLFFYVTEEFTMRYELSANSNYAEQEIIIFLAQVA